MKTNQIFLILFLCTTISYGQRKFEKGYLIDNENHKTECFIRNYEWNRNPVECEYKLTENGEVKKADIASVKEFFILGSSKFIRADVKIDRSPAELSISKNPVWNQELLFLKVLIQGKASLYHYVDRNTSRFFYSVNDSPIQQLIYKEYIDERHQVVANYSFRQQLLNEVFCGGNAVNSINDIHYSLGELEKIFKDYNECVGDSFIVYDQKINKGKINLKVTPGINYSSVSISTFSKLIPYKKIDFDSNANFRIGLEAEYILPFYNNKLGIVCEPSYEYYNSKKIIDNSMATINYNSIQLSFGGKYYFFLNEKSKLFITGLINSVASLNFNSKVEYEYSILKMKDDISISFGAGIDFKKISAEFRYFSNQEILYRTKKGWASEYQKASFILGYKIK